MKGLAARDVMTTEVLTVGAHWSVARLAEYLTEHGISGAPVLDEDGALVGVVSVTDVVRHDSLPEKEGAAGHREHTFYLTALGDRYSGEDLTAFDVHGAGDVLVQDIMTRTIFKIDAGTPLPKIIDMLVTGRIHRVIVTDGRRLVGLVTALDLLRALRQGDSLA